MTMRPILTVEVDFSDGGSGGDFDPVKTKGSTVYTPPSTVRKEGEKEGFDRAMKLDMEALDLALKNTMSCCDDRQMHGVTTFIGFYLKRKNELWKK